MLWPSEALRFMVPLLVIALLNELLPEPTVLPVNSTSLFCATIFKVPPSLLLMAPPAEVSLPSWPLLYPLRSKLSFAWLLMKELSIIVVTPEVPHVSIAPPLPSVELPSNVEFSITTVPLAFAMAAPLKDVLPLNVEPLI